MSTTKREDGQETRGRLLGAAVEIFSEKGFHETKVAAICRRAGTNVAAVNYYFGSKAELYVSAWHHAYLKADLQSPPTYCTGEHPTGATQLTAYIDHLIREFTNQSKIGQLNRL